MNRSVNDSRGARYSGQFLATVAIFQNRVRESLINVCIQIIAEGPTTTPFHRKLGVDRIFKTNQWRQGGR
jgi:hypothetical protein